MNADSTILYSKEVISKREILGIVALFVIILIVLFPKGKLKKMLYTDTTNYALSINYLECLSKAYPQNINFKIALLGFYSKAGKLNKAEKLIKNCKNKEPYITNIGFIRNSYLVYKTLYFKYKDKKYLNNAKFYLKLLLEEFPTEETYNFVFNESKSMYFPKLEYRTLKVLIKRNPNENYLKTLLSLSIYYKDFKTAIDILNYMYDKEGKITYIEKEAEIYAYTKNVRKAETIYLNLFKTAPSQNLRRNYFVKLINLLMWNKMYKQAVAISKNYEDYFTKTDDKLALKKILDVYLQTGNLSFARKLSLKILRRSE